MLKSLNLGYDTREDRLVLRVISDDSSGEQVLHLTRRVCALWRQDLQAMVDRSAELPASLPQAVKTSVSAAHHQAIAAQAPIRRDGPLPDNPPERPRLVSAVRCGIRQADKRWMIQFQTVDGAEVGLQLSTESMHGLVKLLQRQLERTQWQLPTLPFDRPGAATPDERSLH